MVTETELKNKFLKIALSKDSENGYLNDILRDERLEMKNMSATDIEIYNYVISYRKMLAQVIKELFELEIKGST